MILKTDSWHYKLWEGSFGFDKKPPPSTDLCRYCHRVFWQIVARIVFVCMVGITLAVIGYGVIYEGFILHTKITFAATGVIVLLVTSVGAYFYWLNHKGDEPKTLVGKWVAARKQRVCPVVEFDHRTRF